MTKPWIAGLALGLATLTALAAGLVHTPAQADKAPQVECDEINLDAGAMQTAMDARVKAGWKVVSSLSRPTGMRVKAIVCYRR